MRICVNFSVNSVGGGKYHAYKFIQQYLLNPKDNYFFVLNNNFELAELPPNHIKVKSPAKSLTARRIIGEYVRENNIDLVYTMAGPSYVNFSCKHILGLSNAWLLTKNHRKIFRFYPLHKSFKEMLRITWQRFNIDRSASLYIFQSRTSLEEFNSDFDFMKNKSRVVENAYFYPKKSEIQLDIDIAIMGSLYAHKGIYDIYKYLYSNLPENFNRKISFFVTDSEWNKITQEIGKRNCLTNLGVYSPDNEVNVLKQAELVILPSYLETISGTALNAGLVKARVLARNTTFNHEIFGLKCNYFDDYRELINSLSRIDLVFSELKYPRFSYGQRFDKITEIIENKCAE